MNIHEYEVSVRITKVFLKGPIFFVFWPFQVFEYTLEIVSKGRLLLISLTYFCFAHII